MDQITSDIRDMYEKFPYPSGKPTNRLGSDVDLILSYGALAPAPSGTRQVLDAGCGRALGLIGAATLQPEVQFTGIDILSLVYQRKPAFGGREPGLGAAGWGPYSQSGQPIF